MQMHLLMQEMSLSIFSWPDYGCINCTDLEVIQSDNDKTTSFTVCCLLLLYESKFSPQRPAYTHTEVTAGMQIPQQGHSKQTESKKNQ